MTRWYFRVFTCLRAHTSEASSGVDGSYIRALDQALDSMVDWDGYHEDIFRQELFRVEQAIFKKRVDAAKTIQKYWRRAISNPNYVVCRNRLEYSGFVVLRTSGS